MTSLYILTPGKTSVISTGGRAVQVADNTMGVAGGLIINPLQDKDQTIFPPESLFINIIGDAGVAVGTPTGTIELLPGQRFLVPPLVNVSVNAFTSGHKFTAIFSTIYEPSIREPVPGIPGGESFGIPIFPPSDVTGLKTVIPSYLYQEYSDDNDLQGFVVAQNQRQQDYVDTFNALNLPIYTGPIVQGALLDWVGQGLYGLGRPTLSSGIVTGEGPLNTWGCNFLVPLNEIKNYVSFDVSVTNDDTYRRILTWHFYKGDGKYFDVRWLKRRIWRFLFGVDGKAPETAVWEGRNYSIADTEQISISMGVERRVSIRFILGKRTVTGGAMLNEFGCNGFGPPSFPLVNLNYVPIPLNDVRSNFIPYPPLPYMDIFKEAVGCGALELPYQFTYIVTISTGVSTIEIGGGQILYVNGILTIIQGDQTLSSIGFIGSRVTGTLIITQGNQILSSTGFVGNPVTGTLIITQGNQILSSTGLVATIGGLALREDNSVALREDGTRELRQ